MATRVLVAGAGIAGPALGLALARMNIEAVIYEAATHPRDDAGAFLNVAPNGRDVLVALGVADALDDVGVLNDRLAFYNEHGRMLAEVPVGGTTVMRGALSRMLRDEAVRAGVRIEFGMPLDSVCEENDGVTARFIDGTAATGDCLIAADGIHSRTRTSVWGTAPSPAYTGVLNLGGVVSTDLPPTGRVMRMVFGRRAFFGYAVEPSGRTFWFGNDIRKREPSREELERLDSRALREHLLDLHRDDPEEISAILRAVSGPIGAYAVYDMPRLEAWRRGRICLIGDAAHAVGPHAGQGVSLALEDALIVAACLRDAASSAEAFSAFERLRRPRVDPIVYESRRIGRQKAPRGWLARRFRDAVLPVFLRKSAESAGSLYDYPLLRSALSGTIA